MSQYTIGGVTFAPKEPRTSGHDARLAWFNEDCEIEELRRENAKLKEEVETLKHMLRSNPWTS